MGQTSETFPAHRMQITDDLDLLLDIFPNEIRTAIEQHSPKDSLIEIVMDLGRKPEIRFTSYTSDLSENPITQEDLDHCISKIGNFSGDNRAGIERTLHRISAMRNRNGDIIGLTCRIGRAVFGTILMIQDLIETGQSILLLGRPGVGKTTALREIARVLADDLKKRVVIIDTSNEIAGDGDIPHPAIGRARRMQVARPELQHQVMIEAVENHMPEVIVIDEIGTELEALAARTIAERGVQLVGTAHGNQIENLIKNPTLSDLVGGIQSVTLGDEEARRRGSQKTVLERKALPTFQIGIEMQERYKWVIHPDLAMTIDNLLRNRHPNSQIREINEEGNVTMTQETPPTPPPERFQYNNRRRNDRFVDIPLKPFGLRAEGKMTPIQSNFSPSVMKENSDRADFEQMLDQSWYKKEQFTEKVRIPGPNGEDLPLYVYPYGIGRSHLEEVIKILNLPIVITKDLDNSDAVLALRSQVKHHSKLCQIAKARELPIHTIKSNTIAQITRGLQKMLNSDDEEKREHPNPEFFITGGSDDQMDALEEARLAVEQIVIPKQQAVELLPRTLKVRKMQHELVEHYRLRSDSCGEEPNRRLRIYPA